MSKKVYQVLVAKRAATKARKDMMEILVKCEIDKTRRTKRIFDNEPLRRTVLFILQRDHVQTLSWGTKRLKVHGQ